jgi:hypothetical protein
MVVPIRADRSFEAGSPQSLFQTRAWRFTAAQIYAVTRDGQRFLVNATSEKSSPAVPLTVVLNWTSGAVP